MSSTTVSSTATTMYYRTLGNTGLVSSIFGFGFWATFGVKPGLLDRQGIDSAKEILSMARKGGINLFDNAETYGNPMGEAERIFGQAYKELVQEEEGGGESASSAAGEKLWTRSQVLITTKLFWGGTGYNERGLSRKHIMEGMNQSLKRLQLDYVDLVYCHRPDSITPTETVVRAMTELVRTGKAMAWGTSEWSAQQITEAVWIAKTEGLEPPQVEQPQYHMFERERVEKEYFPLYERPYNLALTTWSPLASGLLTGKYKNGIIPEGSRASQPGYGWLGSIVKEWQESGKFDKVQTLEDYAKKNLDCSVGELAIAWCVKNPHVTCILLGATNAEQIQDNLQALKVVEKLTPQHMEDIEAILKNKPKSYWGNGVRTFPTI